MHFRKCTSLQSITIPSSVTCIEKEAFDYCNNLQEVVLHNEGVQIGDDTFTNCTSLERFKFLRLSTRLDNIIQAGQRGIEAKMDDIPTVEWRDGELVIPVAYRLRGSRGGTETLVEVNKEKLDKIVRLIRYYEIKVATTLFELALWKANLDQAVDGDEPADRGAYRVEVPGPVKETLLQYLNLT